MNLEIQGKVFRDSGGTAVGLELVSGPEAYSEAFIREFPQEFIAGKARIGFVPGGIAFESAISGVSGKHQIMLSVDSEDLVNLRGIFTAETKLNFERISKLTPAFRVTALHWKEVT